MSRIPVADHWPLPAGPGMPSPFRITAIRLMPSPRGELEEPPFHRCLRRVHAQLDVALYEHRDIPIDAAPRMMAAPHLAEHLVADARGRPFALEGRAKVRDGHQQRVRGTLQLSLGSVREEDAHPVV